MRLADAGLALGGVATALAALNGAGCGSRTGLTVPTPSDAATVAPLDVGVTCERDVTISFHVGARHSQLAVWVTQGDRFATLALTEAVGRYGIGNRPGAYQMNSAYRWPYGRRWNVLPGWGEARSRWDHERLFRTVVFFDNRFRDRQEGFASGRTDTGGGSDDRHFCQTFYSEETRRDGLDAVTCPSLLHSDKGRYLPPDLTDYFEPEETDGTGHLRIIPPFTPYPPRRDLVGDVVDHPDVAQYAEDASSTMPELDGITMATPAAGEVVTLRWRVPPDWSDAPLDVSVEVNTEGDYNDTYNPVTYPIPAQPDGAWDYWARMWGYPYRGQPSVVFDLSVPLPPTDRHAPDVVVVAETPARRGTLDASLRSVRIDDSITDDPSRAPGSGADRLARDERGGRVTAVATQVACAAPDG